MESLINLPGNAIVIFSIISSDMFIVTSHVSYDISMTHHILLEFLWSEIYISNPNPVSIQLQPHWRGKQLIRLTVIWDTFFEVNKEHS